MTDEARGDIDETMRGAPPIGADSGDAAADAALAEGWAAFAHLLAAAEAPVDEAALVVRVGERIERRARRRRLRIGAFALASAASLLVAAGIVATLTRGTSPEALAVAGPPGAAARWIPWEDDVDQQAASLAVEARGAEFRWQHGPDSESLLQARADELAQEMAASPL